MVPGAGLEPARFSARDFKFFVWTETQITYLLILLYLMIHGLL